MTFIISLNIQELGAGPKYLPLKHLLSSLHPYVIIIQETMHSVPQVVLYFWKMFPNWYIYATVVVGLSGGLVALLDPRWIKIKAYKCFAGILL